MNQKIIYIAGPMRGYEDYNSKAFNDKEKVLRELGYLVINPSVLPKDLPEEHYMPICLAMVRECDAVIMLDGYQNSSGSMVEYSFAIQCHIPVFTSTSELQNFLVIN